MIYTGLICRNCRYVFNVEKNPEDLIVCPYCKFQGKFDEFDDYGKQAEKDGYRRALEEFKDLIKRGDRRKIERFFEKNVAKYGIKYEEGDMNCYDTDGNRVKLEAVHDYIQGDVVLQRDLYNLWMDQFR